MLDITTFDSDELEQDLRETLTHIYDPDYQPSETIYALTGCDTSVEPLVVQTMLLHRIESLEPSSDVPASAYTKVFHDLLYNRFVLKLTQEETAERLHMSRTSLQRTQRQAVHALTQALWDRRRQEVVSAQEGWQETAVGKQRKKDTQAPDWSGQAKRELASIEAHAPDAVANVEETISFVLTLSRALLSGRDLSIEVASAQPGITAAIHPVVLRQMLITAIRRIERHSTAGKITLFTRLEAGNVKITLTAPVASGLTLTEEDLIHNIVSPDRAHLEAHIEAERAYLWLELPSSEKITVLAVDDNADMALFYRRVAEGTRYHIVHIAEGRNLFEEIDSVEPDVIILDVMLPDIDGWVLLMDLHENPSTRSIPVIVCSVVRDEDLALSLGASSYLAKPVRPRDLVQALDLAVNQVPAEA